MRGQAYVTGAWYRHVHGAECFDAGRMGVFACGMVRAPCAHVSRCMSYGGVLMQCMMLVSGNARCRYMSTLAPVQRSRCPRRWMDWPSAYDTRTRSAPFCCGFSMSHLHNADCADCGQRNKSLTARARVRGVDSQPCMLACVRHCATPCVKTCPLDRKAARSVCLMVHYLAVRLKRLIQPTAWLHEQVDLHWSTALPGSVNRPHVYSIHQRCHRTDL